MKIIDKNYKVFKDGSVFSKQKKLFLKPINNKGYLQVKIGSKLYLVHRAVAITYLKNDKNYKYVNHKNGIKSDNRLENLEWCSHSQNIKHAYNSGLMTNKNDKARNKKLSSLMVSNIRGLYKTGKFTQKRLAKIYDTHQSNISLIVTNKHWVL